MMSPPCAFPNASPANTCLENSLSGSETRRAPRYEHQPAFPLRMQAPWCSMPTREHRPEIWHQPHGRAKQVPFVASHSAASELPTGIKSALPTAERARR